MKPLKAGAGSPLPPVGGRGVLISLSEWSIFVKISCVFMNSLFGHGFDVKMWINVQHPRLGMLNKYKCVKMICRQCVQTAGNVFSLPEGGDGMNYKRILICAAAAVMVCQVPAFAAGWTKEGTRWKWYNVKGEAAAST